MLETREPGWETALKMANCVRLEAARQRNELRHSPARVLIPALIDPPPELGTYSLRTLFGREHANAVNTGLIRYVGPRALALAMREIEAQNPLGRRWRPSLKLGELTRPERIRLVRAIVKRAPKSWREGRS